MFKMLQRIFPLWFRIADLRELITQKTYRMLDYFYFNHLKHVSHL